MAGVGLVLPISEIVKVINLMVIYSDSRKGDIYLFVDTYPNDILHIQKFTRVFYFRETSHVRSFVKIKSSRNGEITLSFTDIGKACPSLEF